jgi:hypothetical protein
MAELARHAEAAVKRLSVENDAGPDSVSYVHADKIFVFISDPV